MRATMAASLNRHLPPSRFGLVNVGFCESAPTQISNPPPYSSKLLSIYPLLFLPHSAPLRPPCLLLFTRAATHYPSHFILSLTSTHRSDHSLQHPLEIWVRCRRKGCRRGEVLRDELKQEHKMWALCLRYFLFCYCHCLDLEILI